MIKYSVVDEAGYIRLPEWIRKKLGLKELDKVEFIEKDREIVIKKIEPLPWEELEEMLKVESDHPREPSLRQSGSNGRRDDRGLQKCSDS